jgi:hypothetical protein
MTAQRKSIGIRFDEDVVAGLQMIFERDGILPSEQVRRAVTEWLSSRGVALVVRGSRGSEGARKVAKKIGRK